MQHIITFYNVFLHNQILYFSNSKYSDKLRNIEINDEVHYGVMAVLPLEDIINLPQEQEYFKSLLEFSNHEGSNGLIENMPYSFRSMFTKDNTPFKPISIKVDIEPEEYQQIRDNTDGLNFLLNILLGINQIKESQVLNVMIFELKDCEFIVYHDV